MTCFARLFRGAFNTQFRTSFVNLARCVRALSDQVHHHFDCDLQEAGEIANREAVSGALAESRAR